MKVAIGALLAALAGVGTLLLDETGENGGPPVVAQAPNIPAFPGARGAAATAMQSCRELPPATHFVTNTNAEGPGSLRAALEANTPGAYDFVILRTGGRIVLGPQQNLIVREANCLYLAGQTAPGGGVIVCCNQFHIRPEGAASVANSAGSDIVYRYITTGKNRSNQFKATNVVVDHFTCFWTGSANDGGDDCYNLGTRPDNPGEFNDMPWVFTLSNSLAFEMHDSHPTVCHTSGESQTIYRNLLTGPGHRVCQITTNRQASSGSQFINNVVYNTTAFVTSGIRDSRIDHIGNYYRRGPSTDIVTAWRRNPFLWQAYCPSDPNTCITSSYFDGNRSIENNFAFDTPIDSVFRGGAQSYVCQQVGAGTSTPDCTAVGGNVPLAFLRRDPLPTGDWAYVPRTMTDGLVQDIALKAGNYRGLACDGTWVLRRDSLSQNAVNNFLNRTGRSQPANFQSSGLPGGSPLPDEPGWTVPTPASGTPCTDTSGDGIPDDWYTRFGFNPASPPPIDSVTVSGYWLIEHYLNGTDPSDEMPWLSVEATYGDLRSAFALPMVLDSVRQGDGWRYFRWPQGMPRTNVGFVLAGVSPPADSAIVLTYDVIPGQQHTDSASVDGLCASWDLYDGDVAACRNAMRTQFVPGAP